VRWVTISFLLSVTSRGKHDGCGQEAKTGRRRDSVRKTNNSVLIDDSQLATDESAARDYWSIKPLPRDDRKTGGAARFHGRFCAPYFRAVGARTPAASRELSGISHNATRLSPPLNEVLADSWPKDCYRRHCAQSFSVPDHNLFQWLHLEKGVFINCYVTQSEVSSAETPRGAP
jgi:hypothetical protein